MMTWLFALTVVWLCAPGNRRHENKASKQIRQQMAKLERIRQRDRERQRQFSDYEREREPYRHERVESVVLVVLQRKHKDVAEVGPWVAKTSNVTLHEVQRPPDERLRDHTRSLHQPFWAVKLVSISQFVANFSLTLFYAIYQLQSWQFYFPITSNLSTVRRSASKKAKISEGRWERLLEECVQ
ncbi:hypothetical protein Tcan_09337 [Toxocara canis]|uniref:Uncharacterized protein n=1 Tax=Toxocara canis TaxID=6265 RepID=A0A0B2VQF9_TOXCA|nr:hypothetical protein Tcan_09337 [Toxocara canis]